MLGVNGLTGPTGPAAIGVIGLTGLTGLTGPTSPAEIGKTRLVGLTGPTGPTIKVNGFTGQTGPGLTVAGEFLEKLRPGGPWLPTAIVPDGKATTIIAHTAAEVDDFVGKHNGKAGLYYSVNLTRTPFNKKAAKTDIVAIEYILGDLDPADGETPEAAKARYLKAIESFEPKPTAAIDSGNGIQGLWRLEKRIELGKPIRNEKGKLEFSPEDQAKIDDVEARAATVMKRLGAKAGTQNIDRILRLPGTTNLPNAKKRKEGRVACQTKLLWFNGASYPLDAFPKEESVTGKGSKNLPPEFKLSDGYEPVARDAPELAKLDAVWVARIFEGDTEGKYKNDRSRLAFAVACELVRAGLDDDFVARVLMTTQCGVHVQESPAYRLPRTIRRAHEVAIDPDLEAMNSQHAVLPIGGKTRVVTWGDDPDFPGRKTIVRAQSFADFKNLHSNKRKRIKTNSDGKQVTKNTPLGHWWLAQQHRRQYDGGQRFMPQHEAEVVGNVLNMFEGFPIQPRKPEGGSGASGCQLFLDHGRKIICSGNEEHWDYLLKREAWIAQNRRRCEVAAAYRTEEEGSGKGFWCNHLGHLYGQYYMQVKRAEHVVGKHNRHLETLLKLCADEAVFVGDPRHRNALFGLITEPTVDVEPKFIDAYSAPNHLNIDIISNAKHFVPASRTARRFFIPTVSIARLRDFEYFKAIEKQLKDGGYEALLYHLLYEVDVRDFEVRRIPKTAGLLEQAEYSRKGLDGLIEKICNDGCVPCAHFEWPGFSVSNSYEIRQGFDYFIDSHAGRELRDLGALKVKRQLRKDWGCKSGDDARRRDGSDMVYGVKWPPLQELRRLFEERHGPQVWFHPEVVIWPMPKTRAEQIEDMALAKPAEMAEPLKRKLEEEADKMSDEPRGFHVIGNCETTTPCAACGQSGGVKRIKPMGRPGAKTESLHRGCAKAWFTKAL